METTRRVRTRFAPSPTGPLHIGGLRTAMYCYFFAKKHGGDFILRIEDTDQNRFVLGAEEYIIEALNWLGIPPNEGQGIGGEYGPYKQSERIGMYREYADMLINNGTAYYAFDTTVELEEWKEKMKAQGNPSPQYNNVTRQYLKNSLALSADEVKSRMDAGEPYVIRFKMPRNEEVKFHDEIRGWVTVNTNQLDDKVLMKSDGYPTYHLANIVDDYTMKISHVIRGEEWLPSAPLHIMMYRAFGWEDLRPSFSHLPLMLRPDGNGKLSKRDGDRLGFPVFPLNWTDHESGENSIGYRERGFMPDALLNFLALCGWNPGNDEEILSRESLNEKFSLEKVTKSGGRFDWDKCKWYNQQYLKNEPIASLLPKGKAMTEAKGWKTNDAYLTKYIELVRERATFVNEIAEIGYYFFEDIKEYDMAAAKKKWKAENAPYFGDLMTELKALATFEATEIEASIKASITTAGKGMGDILPILRVALCGTMQGPPVFDVMEMLGKERSEERVSKFVGMMG
jgi:glutamyl-tRNA synthetase